MSHPLNYGEISDVRTISHIAFASNDGVTNEYTFETGKYSSSLKVIVWVKTDQDLSAYT